MDLFHMVSLDSGSESLSIINQFNLVHKADYELGMSLQQDPVAWARGSQFYSDTNGFTVC